MSGSRTGDGHQAADGLPRGHVRSFWGRMSGPHGPEGQPWKFLFKILLLARKKIKYKFPEFLRDFDFPWFPSCWLKNLFRGTETSLWNHKITALLSNLGTSDFFPLLSSYLSITSEFIAVLVLKGFWVSKGWCRRRICKVLSVVSQGFVLLWPQGAIWSLRVV